MPILFYKLNFTITTHMELYLAELSPALEVL